MARIPRRPMRKAPLQQALDQSVSTYRTAQAGCRGGANVESNRANVSASRDDRVHASLAPSAHGHPADVDVGAR